MNKLLAIMIMLIFVSINVIPTTANPLNKVDIDVHLKGRIGIIIKFINTGNETVNISVWFISVRGGHLGLINKSLKGNATLFAPGDKIVNRIFIFGFGFISIFYQITIPPKKPNGLWIKFLGWTDMFAFGPYVYQRPKSMRL